jgi:hypothetical protein
MNDTQEDIQTDDELLRMQGMLDGPKTIGGLTLRPITGPSWANMQTLGVFDDSIGNAHKLAAYVLLHSESPEIIRSLIFRKDLFWQRVLDWMEKNIKTHMDLKPYDDEFERVYAIYNASLTSAAHPSDPSPASLKN